MDIESRNLTNTAIQIWQAGVQSVDPALLVRESVEIRNHCLLCDGLTFPLEQLKRIVVVGGGKAGTGMAEGLEQALGSEHASRLEGWVNVPTETVKPLHSIHLHGARPTGLNEPTDAGVFGTTQILNLVSELSSDDLCIVLLSGGGSALLPAPRPPVTLSEKQQVTRFLSQAGATIQELNCVRQHISLIKGGRLARLGHARNMITLIISDVLGDPLDMIASGPTVPLQTTVQQALEILERLTNDENRIPRSIWKLLRSQSAKESEQAVKMPKLNHHVIIGNNQTAIESAKRKAASLGYRVIVWDDLQTGEARNIGEEMIKQLLKHRNRKGTEQPVCFLSGGEPVVHLAKTTRSRKGGRNQELILGAVNELWNRQCSLDVLKGIVLLSAGTDGEDGPTDAAGSWINSSVWQDICERKLDPQEDLSINNAYRYFDQLDSLFKPGPTGTNVMDLRVALVGLPEVPEQSGSFSDVKQFIAK